MAYVTEDTPKLDRRRRYDRRRPDRAQAQRKASEERPERKAAKAKWNRDHREQLNAADRARYRANIEAGRAKSRAVSAAYYATEEGKAVRRAWRRNNKDALKLCRVLGVKIAEARRLLEERAPKM